MAVKEAEILFEDNHLLVLNKPAGILSQGDQTGDPSILDTAKAYIKDKFKKPGAVFLGLAHRLDRPVSGVVVLCRTSKSLERMNEIFRERKVEKTYWAITEKKPQQEEGILKHWLLKSQESNRTAAFSKEKKGAKEAILKFKILARVSSYYLWEVQPETGRPHQIRAQLGKAGFPIAGDVKYGYPKANPDGNINLHAREISFLHPVKKEPVRITARPPDTDFWNVFEL